VHYCLPFLPRSGVASIDCLQEMVVCNVATWNQENCSTNLKTVVIVGSGDVQSGLNGVVDNTGLGCAEYSQSVKVCRDTFDCAPKSRSPIHE
jgi:hypothetical protein